MCSEFFSQVVAENKIVVQSTKFVNLLYILLYTYLENATRNIKIKIGLENVYLTTEMIKFVRGTIEKKMLLNIINKVNEGITN